MPFDEMLGLPRDLGGGLTLRWAVPDDAEALAQFNLAMHTDNPAEPEMFLYHWTHDMMRGNHPTTRASDFTVVVDEDGAIISSLNLISQTWAYEGIPFGVGRPELVATLPEFRRRGLVRLQMDIIHRKSEVRGEMVQAITGIPWYYRQFGYEMALNLGGGRRLYWPAPGNDEKVDQETYRLRPAEAGDIPVLAELYRAHLGRSPVVRLRDEAIWHYELFDAHPESIAHTKTYMILLPDDRPIAYVEYEPWGATFELTELGVLPDHSWRAVVRFLTRYLREEAAVLNPTRAPNKQIGSISFTLGEVHAAYEALGRDLESPKGRPYAWYIRVRDIPAFLRHIAPALERRLAGSVMAGHSGVTKVNLYHSRFTMVWENGRLVEIGDNFAYDRLEDGDVRFPEQTFLQLLFGYRSRHDIYLAFADSYAQRADTEVLLDAIFPRRPSIVLPLE